MAVEKARGCGYRRVGGIYLVGTGLAAVCDRLPIPILPCTTCGAEIRFHRALARIEPYRLWGNHHRPFASSAPGRIATSVIVWSGCTCRQSCPVCYPGPLGWQMWVGSEYTPASFIAEAGEMGVSKRISRIPNNCEIGDWVFLSHRAAIPPRSEAGKLPFDPAQEDEQIRRATPGIFYVFRITGVEKIVTESQSRDEAAMGKLRAAGITPVVVPDDDPDHAVRRTEEGRR